MALNTEYDRVGFVTLHELPSETEIHLRATSIWYINSAKSGTNIGVEAAGEKRTNFLVRETAPDVMSMIDNAQRQFPGRGQL